MARLNTSFVLGYHGCEESLGTKAVNGELALTKSDGAYDWLGPGTYFWEGDPQRAMEWAEEKVRRKAYKAAFVIGAVIDLGNCLDLLVRENIELVRDAYDSFAEQQTKAGLPLPENKEAPKDQSYDHVLRYLDCAIIRHLHTIIAGSKLEPFDSVRGLFTEGGRLYKGSGFKRKTHSQIAVCNPDCIKGVFLPR